MRKNTELSKQELNEILQQFYEYFQTGYKFEEFLKHYLERIGFEEVFVTNRSRDGGIDLTAVRKSIGGFSQSIDDNYYIQAKRYKPSENIRPAAIRALRGSFPAGKGIFITTARVSDNAKREALSLDAQRPIIVVDGKELVTSCIDLEIGFIFRPVFSSAALKSLVSTESQDIADGEIVVEKQITESNIRTYILPIPKDIKANVPGDVGKLSVSFNGGEFADYNIDAGRRYLGGVTSIYRRYGLLQPDGAVIAKKARWSIDDTLSVRILIED